MSRSRKIQLLNVKKKIWRILWDFEIVTKFYHHIKFVLTSNYFTIDWLKIWKYYRQFFFNQSNLSYLTTNYFKVDLILTFIKRKSDFFFVYEKYWKDFRRFWNCYSILIPNKIHSNIELFYHWLKRKFWFLIFYFENISTTKFFLTN